MIVNGYVQQSVQITRTAVNVYALYVPDIAYKIIIGTNVLHTSGTKLICNDKQIWPTSFNSKSDNQCAILFNEPRCIMMSVESVIIPPLSGLNIQGRMSGKQFKGDILVEHSKHTICDGNIARQLHTAKNGLVNIFVTNASPKHSLVIPKNMAIAIANGDLMYWRDDEGVILKIDPHRHGVKDELSAQLSDDSAEQALDENSLKRKGVNRRARRALEWQITTIQRAYSGRKPRKRHCFDNLIEVNAVNSDGLCSNEKLVPYNISSHLNNYQKEKMCTLLEKHKDLWTVDSHTTTPLIKHPITTLVNPINNFCIV